MAASTYNVVIISYTAPPLLDEYAAAGAITPGMLVELTSAGKVQAHSDDAPAMAHAATFADLDPYQPSDSSTEPLDTAYAADDLVRVYHAKPGDKINALLEVGANVAIGALLESNGAGALQARTTGHPVARALQAVDNSGGSASARIKVEVL